MKTFTLKEEIEYLLNNDNKILQDMKYLQKNYTYENNSNWFYILFSFFLTVILYVFYKEPKMVFIFMLGSFLISFLSYMKKEEFKYRKSLELLKNKRNEKFFEKLKIIKSKYKKEPMLFNIIKKIKLSLNLKSIKYMFLEKRDSFTYVLKENFHLKFITRAVIQYHYKNMDKKELLEELSNIIVEFNIEKDNKCEISTKILECFDQIYKEVEEENEYRKRVTKYTSLENQENDLEYIQENKQKLNNIISL